MNRLVWVVTISPLMLLLAVPFLFMKAVFLALRELLRAACWVIRCVIWSIRWFRMRHAMRNNNVIPFKGR
jgi:hypothetical protein